MGKDMGRSGGELEKRIGYIFKNREMLETALTHSSYVNENRGRAVCYERLEFLGDSVLGMLTADMLFHTFKNISEGELTRRRAMLVCEASLAQAADELELGRHMRLGRGEDHTGGRSRPSILADVLEAIVAALYLDGGVEVARRFAESHIFGRSGKQSASDYKTELQEKVQAVTSLPLVYRLIEETGPDHNKRFTVEVLLDGRHMGGGTGANKKEAEQLAAREALTAITKEGCFDI